MSKRISLILSFLVIASVLLTACGGGAETPAPDQPAVEEKIEIRFWGHQAPAFNEANQAKLRNSRRLMLFFSPCGAAGVSLAIDENLRAIFRE